MMHTSRLLVDPLFWEAFNSPPPLCMAVFLRGSYGALYYKLELRVVGRVEVNLEAPKIEVDPFILEGLI